MRVRPTRLFRSVLRARYHTAVHNEGKKDVPQYVAELKRCAKMQDLEAGKRIHEDVIRSNLHADRYVAPALITMYSKCKSVNSAKTVFDCMASRNVITWNALIQGYVENGQSAEALDLFSRIDCQPNPVTYIAALKACKGLTSENESRRQASLEIGVSIHKQLEQHGHDSDVAVVTTLIDMYCKCRNIDLAREIFEKLKKRNVITCNVLMLGYVENGRSREAIEFFMNMDCTPSSVSYIAFLKALKVLSSERLSERQSCLEKGIRVHKELEIRGFETDVSVATTLLDMYFKCESAHRARYVFERMKNKNVVTWNTTILGYVENGDCLTAMDVFERIDCAPSYVTYLAALKACRGLDTETCMRKGTAIHKQVNENGFRGNLLVANSLLSMYGKCHGMGHANEVFEAMEVKDVVTWTSLLAGYVESGDCLEALNVFACMDCHPDHFTYAAALKACAGLANEKEPVKQLRRGIGIHRKAKLQGVKSDVVVGNALVDMYCKYGRMVRSRKVFDTMISKDVITWNSLILGYAGSGEPIEALRLFYSMDCHADCFTYVAALKACTSLGSLEDGRRIHGMICRLGLEQDGVVVTSLMDFYAKCGNVFRSEELFNGMNSCDIVAWNALVTGYSTSGDSAQVVSLAREMQEGGLQMDGVTLTCILAACSHTGLVDEGKRYFEAVCRGGLALSIDHYNCMVDLLGRANRLDEALALVKRMPFAADSVTWTALLGACKKWRNLEIGKVAFDALQLVGAGTRESALFVLMSDILSAEDPIEMLKGTTSDGSCHPNILT